MNTISQTYLKESLDYNPDTGMFVWNVRPLDHFKSQRGCNAINARCAGKVAGSVSKAHGYLVIRINSKNYQAHRLAWLYVNGSVPKDQIDHISHDKLDNRISNLRGATGTENQRNQSMHKRNTSGFTGVCWHKPSSKWQAYIVLNGKLKYLGQFLSIKDAINARKRANVKYNFHSNHGSRR